MFKFVMTAISADVENTLKTNDLDVALCTYIQSYESGLFKQVTVADAETGELYALYDADTGELWQSDEITLFMLLSIAANS